MATFQQLLYPVVSYPCKLNLTQLPEKFSMLNSSAQSLYVSVSAVLLWEDRHGKSVATKDPKKEYYLLIQAEKSMEGSTGNYTLQLDPKFYLLIGTPVKLV